jgi:hypothetical protein
MEQHRIISRTLPPSTNNARLNPTQAGLTEINALATTVTRRLTVQNFKPPLGKITITVTDLSPSLGKTNPELTPFCLDEPKPHPNPFKIPIIKSKAATQHFRPDGANFCPQTQNIKQLIRNNSHSKFPYPGRLEAIITQKSRTPSAE